MAKVEGSDIKKLKEREDFLEQHIKKLERDEKALSEKLKRLEEEEVRLAMKVSNLEQVRKRRPDFLMDYISKEKDPKPCVKAEKPPKKNTKEAVARVLQTHVDEEPIHVDKKKRDSDVGKLLHEVLSKPPEKGPDLEVESAKREGNAKKVLSDVLSSKAPSEDMDILDAGDRSIGSERKQILAAQIKSVLSKKDVKDEPQVDTKKPIKSLSVGARNSESVLLFKLLLAKGVMTIDEAAQHLSRNKDTVRLWAEELESNGIIELSKPLYGSPKLKLKTLTERMQKTLGSL